MDNYEDGGFENGVKAVMWILSPMLKAVSAMYEKDPTLVMIHPRKNIQEIGGNMLEVIVKREEQYAKTNPESLVWLGNRWGRACCDGQRYIGSVECLGFNVVAVADKSSEVAGNRACALAAAMFWRDQDLLSKLQAARAVVDSACSRKGKKEVSMLEDGSKNVEMKEKCLSCETDDVVQSVVDSMSRSGLHDE